jgi:hypothetical protein
MLRLIVSAVYIHRLILVVPYNDRSLFIHLYDSAPPSSTRRVCVPNNDFMINNHIGAANVLEIRLTAHLHVGRYM